MKVTLPFVQREKKVLNSVSTHQNIREALIMQNCDNCGSKTNLIYEEYDMKLCPKCYARVAKIQAAKAEEEYWKEKTRKLREE